MEGRSKDAQFLGSWARRGTIDIGETIRRDTKAKTAIAAAAELEMIQHW
jgi:hypothetical protein